MNILVANMQSEGNEVKPMGTVRRRKKDDLTAAENQAAVFVGQTEETAVEGPGESDVPENAQLATRVCRKLLQRVEKIVDRFPDGAVTETKCQRDDVTQLFKLRDLTAAYKDLAGGIRISETDVEDLSPVMAKVNDDEDDDDESEDGE